MITIQNEIRLLNQIMTLNIIISGLLLILIINYAIKIFHYKNFASINEGKNYYNELKKIILAKNRINKKEKQKKIIQMKLKNKSLMMEKLKRMKDEVESFNDEENRDWKTFFFYSIDHYSLLLNESFVKMLINNYRMLF